MGTVGENFRDGEHEFRIRKRSVVKGFGRNTDTFQAGYGLYRGKSCVIQKGFYLAEYGMPVQKTNKQRPSVSVVDTDLYFTLEDVVDFVRRVSLPKQVFPALEGADFFWNLRI